MKVSSQHAGNGESEGTFRFAGFWDEVRTDRIDRHTMALAPFITVDPVRLCTRLRTFVQPSNFCAKKRTCPLQSWVIGGCLAVTCCGMQYDCRPQMMTITTPNACPARSKGGTDVILYAQKYDGDPATIINVCGRFNLASGITAHFGEDIFARLKREAAISMAHPNNNGPDWLLTNEARRHPSIALHIPGLHGV